MTPLNLKDDERSVRRRMAARLNLGIIMIIEERAFHPLGGVHAMRPDIGATVYGDIVEWHGAIDDSV